MCHTLFWQKIHCTAQTTIYRADDNGMKAAFAAQQGWGWGGTGYGNDRKGVRGGGYYRDLERHRKS